MHHEVMHFIYETKMLVPNYFEDVRVLEIGSGNGYPSPRAHFKNGYGENYIGVDISDGKWVDWVGKGHEFKSDRLFTTVLSCECFEHDPYWEKTIQNMIDHLEYNGLLMFTCASTNRPEHGTLKSNPEASPDTVKIEGWADYYKNLTEQEIKSKIPAFTDGTMDGSYWVSNEARKDLYYRGWKR